MMVAITMMIEEHAEAKCDLKKEKSIGSNKEKIAKRNKIYREANKEKILKKQKEWRENNKERIAKAKKTWRENNKDGIATRDKAYYEANKEVILEKQKLYSQKNKKKISKRNKIYHQNNKNKRNKRQQNKRKEDDLFRLKQNIRTLISIQLRCGGYTKKSKTTQILGCSFEEFKIHIEKQFVEGMNWENRHLWHLDHIIPVSLAVDEEHLIKLNHYTNFQPLWASDNIRKSNKTNVIVTICKNLS
jgi:hypothetical protein